MSLPPCLYQCRRSNKTNRTAAQTCAECGAIMHNMDKRFTTPRRNEEAQWRKIGLMIANDWDGYNWPVSPQMSLREVRDSLQADYDQRMALWRAERIEQGIEQRRQIARVRFRKAKTTLKKQRLEEKRQQLYQEQVMEQVKCVSQNNKETEAAN